MEQSTRRMPSLVAAAAVSIILFCAAGIAAITGILPARGQQGNPPAAPPTTAQTDTQAGRGETFTPLAPTTEPRPDAPRPGERIVQHHHNKTKAARPVCAQCGTVVVVNPIVVQGKTTGVGAIGGAIVGSVAGHQFGKGHGKDAMTAAGLVGGALAGNEIEKRQRQSVRYDVTVRMEDGSHRTVSYAAPPGFNSGDRVRLENGMLRSY